MQINESAEDYLEAIYELSKTLPVVRSVDISTHLGYKKSSVSVAMKHLREKEHITVTDAGFIYLTDSGLKIAKSVSERHEFFTNWLVKMGIDSSVASDEACKIEHILSEDSYKAIKNYVESHK